MVRNDVESRITKKLQELEDEYLDADWAVMDDPTNQHWWYKAKEAAAKLDKFCKKHDIPCIARDDAGHLAY